MFASIPCCPRQPPHFGKPHRRLHTILVLAAFLAFAAGIPGEASAQAPAWPERPIRLVVPFPPGGVTDGIARISADWLSHRLGVAVVVENRPGANGIIAAQAVARSDPDGYTLLTASASQMVMLPAVEPNLPVNMATDFAPISIMASNPMVLGVSAKTAVSVASAFVVENRIP